MARRTRWWRVIRMAEPPAASSADATTGSELREDVLRLDGRDKAASSASSKGAAYDAAVATHVALLRGINVGGAGKVAMSDLRAAVASLGHTDIATYIQSGNVVFTTQDNDAGTLALAAGLERSIAETLGLQPHVIVLSCDELAQVVRGNPYPNESNPRLLHAVFLGRDPEPDLEDRVAAAERQAATKGSRDSARVVGRTIFLHTPDGFGRSELAALLARNGGPMAVGTSGTARNWATVTRLLALCSGG